MNRCAIVITHHKTGTVWMGTLFRHICKSLEIPFRHLDQAKMPSPEDVKPPLVLFTGHASRFREARWLLNNPEHRLFHLIRDPRDVLISAMRYHMVSREEWLHLPQKAFGGLTYQQKLNSLPDDHSRYLFEMDNSSGRIITAMERWNYRRLSSIECKYEQLVTDKDMALFSRVVAHLGFTPSEMSACWTAFWRHSLFGKKSKDNGHIHSGDPRQWPGLLTSELAVEFSRRFGDVLIRLGYEADESWVEQVRAAEPIPA